MFGNSQYWFSNDRSNIKNLTRILERIKSNIRMKTFGLSDADVQDIAQDTLLALVKCSIGLLEKNKNHHVLLTGDFNDSNFNAYIFVAAMHAAYNFNRNIKFMIPNQMERMQGVKYKKIYYELYPTTDASEEGVSCHFSETDVDLETDSLRVDNIHELAVLLKSVIDDALSEVDCLAQQLFLKTVLFTKITSISTRTLPEFAADTGFSHSNYSGLVNRFIERIYNDIARNLELPNDDKLKVFKNVIPDLLFLIKEVYPDDFKNLTSNSKV